MRVGLLRLVIAIPGNRSLKGKRSVLKSIKDRIRSRFNVSVSEVDDQDNWQKAVLGIAGIGNDERYLSGQLNQIRDWVEANHRVEILECETEFL